jgi:hypothetical protein
VGVVVSAQVSANDLNVAPFAATAASVLSLTPFSTGQTIDAPTASSASTCAGTIFQETASGARTDRAHPPRNRRERGFPCPRGHEASARQPEGRGLAAGRRQPGPDVWRTPERTGSV